MTIQEKIQSKERYLAIGSTIFAVLFFSWIIPVVAEEINDQLRQKCLDSSIELMYIKMPKGNYVKADVYEFGFWYIENCSHFEYSEKEVFDRVNKLTQEIPKGIEVSQGDNSL